MGATYFDHNATTPVDPRVWSLMSPWLQGQVGNPSSIHAFGQTARDAVEAAREQVARLVGGRPAEIVFTGSGTEANNTVLFGAAGNGGAGGHLVISEVEHPSVRVAAEALAERGIAVNWVPPDRSGQVEPAAIAAAIRDDTRLVALVLANNVVGTVQPVAATARICRERGVPLLCDAVQAVGKMTVHVGELGVDYLTLCAHKFYGPLGAAALWIRQGAPFAPMLLGGNQERRRRAGTQNVPALVGMGEAARLADRELEERRLHLSQLRDRFEGGLSRIADSVVHGSQAERLPNTTHVAFPGVDNQALLIRLDLAGFAVSAGSACSSGTLEPSPVLAAMGVPDEEAGSSIRVSFGNSNTAAEVDRFLEVLEQQLSELRHLASTAS